MSWQHWILQHIWIWQRGFNTCHIVHLKQLTQWWKWSFTNYTYQGNENRRYTCHTATIQIIKHNMTTTGFHHRGPPRSSNWFYSTSPCEYYNNAFHNSSMTTHNPETSPCARNTIYGGNILSSIMIEETII